MQFRRERGCCGQHECAAVGDEILPGAGQSERLCGGAGAAQDSLEVEPCGTGSQEQAQGGCGHAEEKGKNVGGWGVGESMRDLGKSIDYLLIFVSEWMSGDWCAHVTVCVCVRACVRACVCVTWLIFDRQ